MIQTSASIQSKPLAKTKEWIPTDDAFTANQMIDAYFSGFNKGISDLAKQLKKNCEDVQDVGAAFLKHINSKEPICRAAFFRIENIDSFKIIYALQKDVYRDEEQSRPIYEKSWEISSELNKKEIHLNITFMPYTENINLSRLSSDGYHLSYGELQQS